MLKLIKMSEKYKTQLEEMLEEWINDIKVNKTNHSPWVIFKNDYHDFDNYVKNLETKEPKNGLVPDSTFFLLDEDRNRLIGAANIRHYLNENLSKTGGHIGDGIRPSERGKGYGTKLVALALEECKKLGIDKVLMTCDKNNIGSAKTITNNGGVFDGDVVDEETGHVESRYWINLK